MIADIIVYAAVAVWCWNRRNKVVEYARIAKKKWRARCK